MEEKNYEAIVEAILFTMGESVELEKIAAALELDKKETKKIIENLMKEYEKPSIGMKIIELDGAYQMCTKSEMYEYLIRIAKQPKKHVLTDVLLETLSIIAYKQPITKVEIEKIRGVSCDHAVNKLVEYNLVKELGRLDAPGRPLLFGTTEEFLRSFGVQSLDELPMLDQVQIEEFKQSNFIYHMSYHSIYISNKIDGSAGAAGRSGAFRKGGSLNGWRFRTYFI